MKNSKTINVVKRSFLFIVLGLSLAFCDKDDSDNINPDAGVVDYHQTATTQFINTGGTNFAYRVLGNKAVPRWLWSPL